MNKEENEETKIENEIEADMRRMEREAAAKEAKPRVSLGSYCCNMALRKEEGISKGFCSIIIGRIFCNCLV